MFDRPCVDERTHQRSWSERIADHDLGIGADEPRFQLRCARAMHENPPRARTALTCGPDRTEYDRRHREIEVREFIDDDRIIAAELEQALAEARRNFLGDAAADRGRARK